MPPNGAAHAALVGECRNNLPLPYAHRRTQTSPRLSTASSFNSLSVPSAEITHRAASSRFRRSRPGQSRQRVLLPAVHAGRPAMPAGFEDQNSVWGPCRTCRLQARRLFRGPLTLAVNACLQKVATRWRTLSALALEGHFGDIPFDDETAGGCLGDRFDTDPGRSLYEPESVRGNVHHCEV